MTQFTGESYLQSMMGHGLRAASQAELVEKLVSRGFLVAPEEIITTFRNVDRAKFLPASATDEYSNAPQKLVESHFMSTPQLHSQIISLLASRLGPGRIASEIGCGSGYLPAVMATMECDSVVAVERDPELLEISRKNLKTLPNVKVSDNIPPGTVLDALYISAYFASESALDSFLSHISFSADAVVVASVKDLSDGPLCDQQLVLLERSMSGWSRTNLFRVLCELLS